MDGNSEAGVLASNSLIALGLNERIRNLLGAVDGGDEGEEGAAGDDEAERAGAGVALFI